MNTPHRLSAIRESLETLTTHHDATTRTAVRLALHHLALAEQHDDDFEDHLWQVNRLIDAVLNPEDGTDQ